MFDSTFTMNYNISFWFRLLRFWRNDFWVFQIRYLFLPQLIVFYYGEGMYDRMCLS